MTIQIITTDGGEDLVIMSRREFDALTARLDDGKGAEHHAAPVAAAVSSASQYFFCRLLPPRPSFAMDRTPQERAVMMQHGAYWREHMGRGSVVVFGPVGDPRGPWGLGVIRVADEATAQAFAANDPAVLSALGLRYEILPMIQAVTPV